MITRSHLRTAAVLGAALPLLVGGGALAAQASGPGAHPARPGHAGPSSQVPSSKVPGPAPHPAFAGYTQVSSGALADAPQAQTVGSAVCPSGTRLVGGGAVISGTSLNENLNASIPSADGRTWIAYVANVNTTAGSFFVYADCVQKVAKYAVVSGAGVDNPAGHQDTATVTCPTGTVPLGGGGNNGSSSTAVLLNSSLPISHGWRVDINNNGGGGDTINAAVICGRKPAGYAVTTGPGTAVAGSAQGSDAAVCPTGTVVLGGGGLSSSSLTSVDLNSSFPTGSTGWRSYIDDTAVSGSTITAYAVCAQA